MSFLVEKTKKDLLQQYIDCTDTSADYEFWERVMMLRAGKFHPSYEDDSKIADFDKCIIKAEEQGYHTAGKGLSQSLQSKTYVEDQEISTFISDIIAKAEDEFDTEFWRDYEAKLYGVWLRKDYDGTNDTCSTDPSSNENWSIKMFHTDTSATRDNVLRWLYRNPKYTINYKEDKHTRMAQALKLQLHRDTDGITSTGEQIAEKNRLIRNYERKMKKRPIKVKVSGLLTRAFSCFKRQKCPQND